MLYTYHISVYLTLSISYIPHFKSLSYIHLYTPIQGLPVLFPVLAHRGPARLLRRHREGHGAGRQVVLYMYIVYMHIVCSRNLGVHSSIYALVLTYVYVLMLCFVAFPSYTTVYLAIYTMHTILHTL